MDEILFAFKHKFTGQVMEFPAANAARGFNDAMDARGELGHWEIVKYPGKDGLLGIPDHLWDSAEVAVVSVDAPALREDGPTMEEFEGAGYLAEHYPPTGYAERVSVRLEEYKAKLAAVDAERTVPGA